MSRGDRASRRGAVRVHLRAEALEGRTLMAAGPAKPHHAPAYYFKLPEHAVFSQQDSEADVTVVRSSPRGPGRAVVFTDVASDPEGTAVAGRHYHLVHKTVDFQNGETTQTVSIPIVPGAENPGEVAFRLFVRPETPDGSTESVAITIVDRDDVTPPRIIDARLVAYRNVATAIAVTFSEPMAPGGVQDAGNYAAHALVTRQEDSVLDLVGLGLFDFSKDRVKPVRIGLESATYDPATNTATLTLSRPVRVFRRYTISDPGDRDVASLPADVAGNPLSDFQLTINHRADRAKARLQAKVR